MAPIRPSATRMCRSWPGCERGHAREGLALGVGEHRVAAAQSGQRRQRPDPGQLVGQVVVAAVEPVTERATRPVGQGATSASRSSSPPRGSASTGREAGPRAGGRSRSTRAPMQRRPRSRSCSTRCASSATSGTTRLAASVGVDARTSATRSRIGESGSWPIAETRGVVSGRDGAHQALVGEGQQVLDRAAAAGDDDDVDRGVAVEGLDGRDHVRRSAGALHRGVLHGEGDARPARRAFSSTSRSAAEPWAVTSPTLRGRNGRARLSSAANRPSCRQQPAASLQAGQQLALSDQPDLADGEGQ